MPPVHAGLFAASDDEDPGGGFYMAGSDEEALFSELAVVHVLHALSDVVQFLCGFCRGLQRLGIVGFEAFDDGGGTAAIEEAF